MKKFLTASGIGTGIGAVTALLEYTVYVIWTYANSDYGFVGEHGAYLAVAGLGAVAGSLVGLGVWLLEPARLLPCWRHLWTRGLTGAGLLLLTLILVAGVYGFLAGFSMGHGPGDTGLGGSLIWIMIAVIFWGGPASLLGFLTGISVAFGMRKMAQHANDGAANIGTRS